MSSVFAYPLFCALFRKSDMKCFHETSVFFSHRLLKFRWITSHCAEWLCIVHAESLVFLHTICRKMPSMCVQEIQFFRFFSGVLSVSVYPSVNNTDFNAVFHVLVWGFHCSLNISYPASVQILCLEPSFSLYHIFYYRFEDGLNNLVNNYRVIPLRLLLFCFEITKIS